VKNIRLGLFIIALMAFSVPAAAMPISLGVAGDFNTFVFNDFYGSSDTEGRLAVGGNARLKHYSVGDKLDRNSKGDMLVVGGNLNFSGGRVYYGDMRVGGNAHLPNYQIQDGNLYTNAQMPFDFAAEQAYLTRLSADLAERDTNGRTIKKDGAIKLKGKKNEVQVFNVSGDDLLAAHGLTLKKIAKDATIVINVSGEHAGLTNMGMESFRRFGSNVLFNFYEAKTLDLHGVGIHGSILAPLADILNPRGVINGTIIASSFHGPMQQNHVPFESEIPPASIPEPSTIALVGLGLLCLAGIKRKR